MQIVKLKVNDLIYDQLIQVLSKFNKNELEIIDDQTDFEMNQVYLKGELSEIVKEEATFYEIDQLEEKLERIIQQYESSI